MDTIKRTVKIAGFLLVVLLALGCGGSMQGPTSSLNQPAVRPAPATANRASSKFVYVVNSIEETVQGFAIEAATGALTSAGPAFATDEASIDAAATPDGRFLYVANAGTDAIGVSAYRVDGLRGSLMPTAPAEFATTGDCEIAIDPMSGGLSPLSAFSRGQFTPPRGIAVDGSGSFLYSAWNMQNRAGAAAIDSNGGLSAVSGAPVTRRGSIGVALSGRQ